MSTFPRYARVALGLREAAIDRRVGAARLHRLHRGVYAVGHRAVRADGHWMAAVLALGGDAVLSHATAAAAWDLRRRGSGAIHVTVPSSAGRKRRAGIRLHRSRTLTADETTTVRAIPVTSPVRTIIDLAATLTGRPLEALIQPRALPELDLLRVRAADAVATARCAGGVPTFAGSSSLASVAVNGRELGLESAVTETVRLIDSQTLDPANVDISRIVRPPGVDLTALQAVIKPVLDALPNITVPATVARIRVTPNERIASGTRLIQRALHAEITIAGRQLADVIAGEAIVGVGDVSCGGVADLALECTLRRLVLIDVYEQGGRVRLLGAADRRYVGRRVRIRFLGTGRTVARPRVRRDGTFRATAPLPGTRIRGTNRARYEAAIRNQRSMRLKLMRRMVVTEMSSRDGVVTIAGRIVQPLTEPVETVLVKRRVTCRRWKVVKRFRPGSDGSFRVRLKAPNDGEAAVYRMTTRVKLYDWFPKTYPTFTLPRYVDLG